MAGLWGTGDYTFVLAMLGPLHLGCTREVAALLRWLLTQVSLYYYVLLICYCTSQGCMQKFFQGGANLGYGQKRGGGGGREVLHPTLARGGKYPSPRPPLIQPCQ